jgi:hypothetical protein
MNFNLVKKKFIDEAVRAGALSGSLSPLSSVRLVGRKKLKE